MAFSADDYLMHHGILGMHWGKRNGPPYPLSPSDHSASEKKAGWRKSLDKGSSSGEASKSKKKGISDKQKTALKVGAGLVVAGLAVYGGYKLSQSGILDKSIDLGKNSIKNDLDTGVGDVIDFKKNSTATPVTGHALNAYDKTKSCLELNAGKTLKKLPEDQVPKTMKDLFGDMTDDNCLHKPEDVSNTCTNVFLAAVARLKGYDALPGWQKDSSGKFTTVRADDIFDCFSPQTDKFGNSFMKPTTGAHCKSYEDASSLIKNRLRPSPPEGSYGFLSCSGFRFGNDNTEYNHAVMWRVENGSVVFGDGMNGLNTKTYFNNISESANINFFRADDKEMDIEKLRKFLIFR